jgi:hypothetical protein
MLPELARARGRKHNCVRMPGQRLDQSISIDRIKVLGHLKTEDNLKPPAQIPRPSQVNIPKTLPVE